MTVREQAIEALLLNGNKRNYVWLADLVEDAALNLALDARQAVDDALWTFCVDYWEISLEAAQLLEEGWVPGQKVVRL